jgi:hypothetical protein
MPKAKGKEGSGTTPTVTPLAAKGGGGASSSSTPGPDVSTNRPLLLSDMGTLLSGLSASFASTFNSCVEKLIQSLDIKFETKIEVQTTEIFNLNKRIDDLEKRCSAMDLENRALRDSLKSVYTRVESNLSQMDDLEQHSRSDNILIHGIPLPTDGSRETNLKQAVVDKINDAMNGTYLVSDQISALHRLGPVKAGPARPQGSPSAANSSPAPPATAPPAIIVRFSSHEARNYILQNRRLLKGKRISVTEQLTIRRASLLKKASTLVQAGKIGSAWSNEGRVLIKSLVNQIMVISNESDLIQFQ